VKSDGSGRVCTVRISLDRAGHNFLSGASCMARITSRVRDDALIIPAAALIPGGKGNAVWVAVPKPAADKSPAPKDQSASVDKTSSQDKPSVAGDTTPVAEYTSPASAKRPAADQGRTYICERREITLGASTVSSVEVVSGLAPGDLVVVDQLPLIQDGQTVRDGSL